MTKIIELVDLVIRRIVVNYESNSVTVLYDLVDNNGKVWQTGEATFRSHRVKKVVNEEIKIMMNITKIRDWMRKELSLNFEEYNDCGEINCTLLAENCCEELDGYEGEDYDIPEEFYDLAVEIAENFEEDE